MSMHHSASPPPPPPQPTPSRSRIVIRVAILFEGGLIVLAWLLGWLLGFPPLESFALSGRDAAWALLATLPVLAALWAAMRYPIGPLRELKLLMRRFVAPLFRDATAVDLALISLLAGLGEEMLFRGVVQMALASVIPGPAGVWLAIGVTSVLFGLGHYLSHAYFVYALLMSVYLGWLLVASGNLLVPILVHAIYDFVALNYLVRER
jgi:uncharacterized protein